MLSGVPAWVWAGRRQGPVSQILAYAAGQSNAGGSSWYGNVKADQVMASGIFRVRFHGHRHSLEPDSRRSQRIEATR